MITALREKISGWVAGVIVGIITVVFSLWGVSSYFTGPVENYIAKVDGLEIPVPEFQRRFAQYKERMSSMFGDNFDNSYFDQPQIKRQFLDGLIREKVIDQNLQGTGYEIPPLELRESIAKMEVFQVDGVFDKSLYRTLLRQRFMSPPEFQSLVRSDMLRAQLPAAITGSSIVTDAELVEIVRLRDQKRSFAYVLIESGKFLDGLEIAEEDILSHYEANVDSYMNPETVTIDYIELDGGKLSQDIEVSDTQLDTMYEEQIKRFTTNAWRKISHILVEVKENASAEVVASALKRAQDLKTRLDAGADFAEMAISESDDKGSAAGGGDLGLLEPEFMEPAFVAGAQSLVTVGESTAPIKSPFGFHIIKLNEIKVETIRPFAEVREELAQEFRESEADRGFLDLAEQLGNLTYEDQNSLEPAAEALALEILQFGPFPRAGGVGLAANKELVDAAFSNTVLENKENSEPIKMGDNHLLVFRVNEHVDAAPKALDEVRDSITAQLKRERANELSEAHAKSLADGASDGQSLQTIASAEGLEPSVASVVKRDDSGVDRSVLGQAFKLSSAKALNQVSMVELSPGRFALIRLETVEDGVWEDLDGTARDALRGQIKSAYGNNEMEAVIASWESKAEIRIREDLL